MSLLWFVDEIFWSNRDHLEVMFESIEYEDRMKSDARV